MHYLYFVHWLKTTHSLDENLPNLSFFDICLVFLVLANLLEDITIIGQLHDITEWKNIYLSLKFTYHKLFVFSSINASLYWITLGCLTEAKILTSLIAFSLSFSLKWSSLTFLRAYCLLSSSLLTLYTFEYAPSPI